SWEATAGHSEASKDHASAGSLVQQQTLRNTAQSLGLGQISCATWTLRLQPRNLKCPAVSPSAAHPPLAPPVGEFGGSCKQQPVSAQLSWMLVDLSQKVQISMKVGCSTVFIKI
ncbi:hypothetical protein LEMLEM_LOCUS2655, partial [Lemmus lemmus]